MLTTSGGWGGGGAGHEPDFHNENKLRFDVRIRVQHPPPSTDVRIAIYFVFRSDVFTRTLWSSEGGRGRGVSSKRTMLDSGGGCPKSQFLQDLLTSLMDDLYVFHVQFTNIL